MSRALWRAILLALLGALAPATASASLPSWRDSRLLDAELRRETPLPASSEIKAAAPHVHGVFCPHALPKTRVRGLELGLHCSIGGEAGLTCTSRPAYALRYGGHASERSVFTGYLWDKETNLFFAKARFYDPEVGRFISQDSYLGQVDTPPSLHRYFYGNANPTRYVDPTGHDNEAANPAVSAETLRGWEKYNREHPVAAAPPANNAPVPKVVTEPQGRNILERGLNKLADLGGKAWDAFGYLPHKAGELFSEYGAPVLDSAFGVNKAVAPDAGKEANRKALEDSHLSGIGRSDARDLSGQAPIKEGISEHATYGGAIAAEQATAVLQGKALEVGAAKLEEAGASRSLAREAETGAPSSAAARDVSYVVDDAGLTVRAEGRISGPHRGRGKGYRPEPSGGRVSGEHRGHLIPEGGVDQPGLVNVRENMISETAASNLGPKKALDSLVSRMAAENPNSIIRVIAEPLRRGGETRPFAVTYWIEKDGVRVTGQTILNK